MHFTLATAAAAALALAPGALAHYRWTHLVVNGATVGSDYQYVRQNTNYNSPVTDVTSNDIRCNTGSQASAANTQTYTVAAGSTIGLGLDQTIYHQSVSALYISKVTKANTADGSTPWVRVAEVDPTFSSGAINFPSEGLTQLTFTLPKTLANGDYLLRAENIAIHAASNKNGAQFYISCAQITVTGGTGTANPSPSMTLPGAYHNTDPGLLINIYYPIPTNYTYPGGVTVWKGN